MNPTLSPEALGPILKDLAAANDRFSDRYPGEPTAPQSARRRGDSIMPCAHEAAPQQAISTDNASPSGNALRSSASPPPGPESFVRSASGKSADQSQAAYSSIGVNAQPNVRSGIALRKLGFEVMLVVCFELRLRQ